MSDDENEGAEGRDFTDLLSSIRKGKHLEPPRVVIYAAEGLGKSTFGSQAPKPIFIQTEDGLGNIDTDSFPLATTYDDVLACIGALYERNHEYETVVLDSLDWLETLIWRHVCKLGNVGSIEDFGYGKGYVAAVDYFREVLDGLNALRDDKKMIVILTAHAQVKRFDDPQADPYDRYMMKLHAKSAAVVSEWCDVVAFGAQEMVVKQEDVGFNKKRSRAVGTGTNVMHLNRRPAFDAKNRYSITKTVPLNWDAFWEALVEGRG